jgi:CBS domain-containing protein
MQVQDVMTKNPMCCLPDTPLKDVAEMMVEHNCGALPVVDNPETLKPIVGMITDRDIVCRVLAEGKNPLDATAAAALTQTVVTVNPSDSLDTAIEAMERHQVRRVVVIDGDGACAGLVTQAQIARNMPEEKAGEMLRRISDDSEAVAHAAASR